MVSSLYHLNICWLSLAWIHLTNEKSGILCCSLIKSQWATNIETFSFNFNLHSCFLINVNSPVQLSRYFIGIHISSYACWKPQRVNGEQRNVKVLKPELQNLSASSVSQRVVVKDYLLSWFERWHSQVRAAGTAEGIPKVTLNTQNNTIFVKDDKKNLSQENRRIEANLLTLPHADFGRLDFCFSLFSWSSSSASPHVLHSDGRE